MSTLKEDLEVILKELKKVGDIEASAVVTRDGLLMASDIPEGIEKGTFAAMTATMTGAAETAISELKKGVPERILIESPETKVISTGAGPKALLVVMTGPDAGLGLILVEMSKAAEKIKRIIG
ncbi:MAG: roadblock/LC7 domain-containing protein [Candidatus Hydrothermarchaeota archaeon]